MFTICVGYNCYGSNGLDNKTNKAGVIKYDDAANLCENDNQIIVSIYNNKDIKVKRKIGFACL